MKNELCCLTHRQKEELLNSKAGAGNIFIAELEGKNIDHMDGYLGAINKILQFPKPSEHYRLSYDGYLDWVRDLEWLNADGYILIINNYASFMKNDATIKNEIIDDFKQIILPWWENEVEQCVVEGKAKSFNVYLVD